MFNNIKTNYLWAIFLFLLVSCGSVKKADKTDVDADKEMEIRSNQKIEPVISKNYLVIDEVKTSQYLKKILNSLFKNKKETPLNSIFAISSERSSLGVRTWVIPPYKIMVDVEILKSLDFESEIAALIAFHYERSVGKGFKTKLSEFFTNENTLTVESLYQWSDIEDFQAIESAVERLYESQYDPRSLHSLFLKIEKFGLTSDYKTPLEQLKTKTLRAISFYPPLLNPVVQSEDFYKAKKVWGRL